MRTLGESLSTLAAIIRRRRNGYDNTTHLPSIARIAEDATPRLAEDGTPRYTEGF